LLYPSENWVSLLFREHPAQQDGDHDSLAIDLHVIRKCVAYHCSRWLRTMHFWPALW